MSTNLQLGLTERLGKAVRAFQEATDTFDEAAAAKLSLNRTDLRCLDVVAQRQPISVTDVGRLVNLTRGATTTALDRLERSGYARRVRHPSDRRGVLIEMTEAGDTAVLAIWGPLVSAGIAMLDGYSETELSAIVRYLENAAQLQLEHLPVAEPK